MKNDLKKRLDQTSVTPDPSVWDRINTRMRHQTALRRWGIVGAAATLVAAGVVVWTVSRSSIDNAPLEVAQLTPTPVVEQQSSSPVVTNEVAPQVSSTHPTQSITNPSEGQQVSSQLVGVNPNTIPIAKFQKVTPTQQRVSTETTTSAAPTVVADAAPSNTTSTPSTVSSPSSGKAVTLNADDDLIYIPNAFSPDDPNDQVRRFKVTPREGSQIISYTIRIFNRGGKLVYASHDVNAAWDGTMHGEAQPMGTYVYVIEYRDAQFGIKHHRGTITLLR